MTNLPSAGLIVARNTSLAARHCPLAMAMVLCDVKAMIDQHQANWHVYKSVMVSRQGGRARAAGPSIQGLQGDRCRFWKVYTRGSRATSHLSTSHSEHDGRIRFSQK